MSLATSVTGNGTLVASSMTSRFIPSTGGTSWPFNSIGFEYDLTIEREWYALTENTAYAYMLLNQESQDIYGQQFNCFATVNNSFQIREDVKYTGGWILSLSRSIKWSIQKSFFNLENISKPSGDYNYPLAAQVTVQPSGNAAYTRSTLIGLNDIGQLESKTGTSQSWGINRPSLLIGYYATTASVGYEGFWRMYA